MKKLKSAMAAATFIMPTVETTSLSTALVTTAAITPVTSYAAAGGGTGDGECGSCGGTESSSSSEQENYCKATLKSNGTGNVEIKINGTQKRLQITNAAVVTSGSFFGQKNLLGINKSIHFSTNSMHNITTPQACLTQAIPSLERTLCKQHDADAKLIATAKGSFNMPATCGTSPAPTPVVSKTPSTPKTPVVTAPSREIDATLVMPRTCSNHNALRGALIKGTNADTYVRRQTQNLNDRLNLIKRDLNSEQIGSIATCDAYGIVHEGSKTACAFNGNAIGADAIKFAETGKGCPTPTAVETPHCEPATGSDDTIASLSARLRALETEKGTFCAPALQ